MLSIQKNSFTFLLCIKICIFVSVVNLLFTPALEAKGRKKHDGKRPTNPKEALKRNIAKLKYSPKIANGTPTFVDSLCLVLFQESDEWVEWEYDGECSGLVISDKCILTWASSFVSTSSTPPVPDFGDPAGLVCYVPRDGCDTAYHFNSIVLSKTAPYDSVTEANDISIFKTEKRMEIGKSICGEYPLFPAPVSCDRNGPPDGYTDCFFVGWGETNDSVDTVESEIQPNRAPVTTLSLSECEAFRELNSEDSDYALQPETQTCVTTTLLSNGICDFDYNAVLYCKYWGKKNSGWSQGNNGWSQGNHGWNGANSAWSKPNSGWGKPEFQPQQILAVGHQTYYYGDTCTAPSAAIIINFGTAAYTDLFGGCDMTCSDSLPPGYECKEKWDPSLGPVYCTPQKIQNHHSGWRKPNPIRTR